MALRLLFFLGRLFVDLPVGERLRTRDDAGNIGIDAVVAAAVGRAVLLLPPAGFLLLAALDQRLLSLTLGRGRPCVSCHAGDPMF